MTIYRGENELDVSNFNLSKEKRKHLSDFSQALFAVYQRVHYITTSRHFARLYKCVRWSIIAGNINSLELPPFHAMAGRFFLRLVRPLRYTFKLGLPRNKFSCLFIVAVVVVFQVFFVSHILVKRNSRLKAPVANEENLHSPVSMQEENNRTNITVGVKLKTEMPTAGEYSENKTTLISNRQASIQAHMSKQRRRFGKATNATTSPTLDSRFLHEYYPPVNFSVVIPHVAPKVDDKDIFLLILINSGTTRNPNRERRKAIRKTWANMEQSRIPSYSSFVNHGFPFKTVVTRNFKLVFLLGKSSEKTLDEEIEQEAEANNDIVIGNFEDTYTNLIVKVFMGLKWAENLNCKYVLKGDDDTYVYLPRLMGILERVPDPFFGGYVVNNGYVFRNPEDKHSISKMYYKDPFYPPYCEGAFYVFSHSLIPDFLRLTKTFKPFHVEDAYLGILLREMGVRPLFMPGFHISNWIVGNMYHFNPCEWATFIALGHKFNTTHIEYIHSRLPLYDPSKLTAKQWQVCRRQPIAKNTQLSDSMLPVIYGILISFALMLICVTVAFFPSHYRHEDGVHLRDRRQRNYYPYTYRAT